MNLEKKGFLYCCSLIGGEVNQYQICCILDVYNVNKITRLDLKDRNKVFEMFLKCDALNAQISLFIRVFASKIEAFNHRL